MKHLFYIIIECDGNLPSLRLFKTQKAAVEAFIEVCEEQCVDPKMPKKYEGETLSRYQNDEGVCVTLGLTDIDETE